MRLGGVVMDEGKLLTPAQVAERLQMEPETVQGWLRTGRLKGVKIGRYWRISPEALREFIEAGQTAGVSLDPNGRNGDDAAAEYDDEPVSAEDWTAIREGIDAIRRGDTVTLEEYDRERQQRR